MSGSCASPRDPTLTCSLARAAWAGMHGAIKLACSMRASCRRDDSHRIFGDEGWSKLGFEIGVDSLRAMTTYVRSTGGGSMVVATIGYEGATLEDFIATLKAANIRTVLDVRELPISRRKGFAKNALCAALKPAGIDYIHLKGLGDPKAGREAARAADMATFRRVFATHMKTPEARADFERAAVLVSEGGVCLMCYERDPNDCHRKLIADTLCDRIGSKVRHLGVRNGIAVSAGRARASACSR